ncbi:MAG: recombinase family protein [Ktedonobacteraceae bacterium]
MLMGYARVSTQDQTLDLQTDALNRAGCEKIFTDTTSGAKSERPGLQEAMNHLRAGDTLVVWRLDRLGRTLKHLIATIADLSEKGIGFRSLQENMDTTTSGGKLIFHIFGALAEFEREIIRERTNAGLQAARARGRVGGRPRIQTKDPKKITLARKLYDDASMPVQEICEQLHISKSTLYRYVGAKTDIEGEARGD